MRMLKVSDSFALFVAVVPACQAPMAEGLTDDIQYFTLGDRSNVSGANSLIRWIK